MDPLSPITPPMPSPISVASVTRRRMLGGALIGAIALGVGAYFLSGKVYDTSYFVPLYSPRPSLDPAVPADWKTHYDSVGEFEFRYPPTWHLEPQTYGVISLYNYPERPRYAREFNPGDVRVEIIVKTDRDVRPGYVQTRFGNVLGYEKIETAESLGLGTGTIRRISLRQSEYSLVPVLIRFDYERNKEVLDQILSTFKFTTSTSTVPADWKTHTNTTLGYELKYPPTLEVFEIPSAYSTLRLASQNTVVADMVVERTDTGYTYPIPSCAKDIQRITIGSIETLQYGGCGLGVAATPDWLRTEWRSNTMVYQIDTTTISQRDLVFKILSTFQFTK